MIRILCYKCYFIYFVGSYVIRFMVSGYLQAVHSHECECEGWLVYH